MQHSTTPSQFKEGFQFEQMIMFDSRHHNRKRNYTAHEAHTDCCDAAAVL